MSLLRLGLCLVFFLTLSETVSVPFTHATQDPIVVEQVTGGEARQVQEISDTFERRMRETRDVNSVKYLFVEDFMRRQIQAAKDFNAGHPVFLIPGIPLSIGTDLATQVSQSDWERLYVARLNFRYYSVLLVASRLKPSDLKKENFTQKLFPSEIFRVIQANPFLRAEYGTEGEPKKYKIETLDEFRSLTDTLEQLTAILRQRFLKHPPERHAPKEQGGGRGFHRITSDGMFELWFVKTDTGIKIAWARVYPFN